MMTCSNINYSKCWKVYFELEKRDDILGHLVWSLQRDFMIRSLTLIKLKWYGHVFKKSIYEYSVALILFFALFGVFSPLIIAEPIARILENNLSLESDIIYFLALNTAFIIVFICQKKLIFNPEFERYTKTLPISQAVDKISSLGVLFASNNFLWVIVGMGSYVAWRNQHEPVIIVETIYLVLSLLMLQLFLYERNISKLICLIFGDMLFIISKHCSVFEMSASSIFLSISIVVLAFSNLKSFSFGIKSYPFKKQRLGISSVLPMQLAMMKPFWSSLLINILFCIVLEVVAMVFISHIENTSLIYYVLIFNYLGICVLSSFSRVLAIESNKMSSYFSSLPLSSSYWFMKNQTLNLILSATIFIPLMCYTLHCSVFSVGTVFYMLFVTTVINIVVYQSNLKQWSNTTLLTYFVASILFTVQFLY